MKLVRDDQNEARTFGTLQLDDGTILYQTIERPWEDNAKATSCIPPGTYTAVRYHSPHFGYEVFRLTAVPGRDGIEIHPANFAHELHGCIAPGEERGRINGEDAVLRSRPAFDAFMALMEGSDRFTLTVEGP